MKTKKLIISPCGTSILTNGAENEIRRILVKNANLKENEISKEDLDIINKRIEDVKNGILNLSLKDAKKRSAELNSLIQYYKNDLNRPQDHHILIKTDTYLGNKTAEIIKSYLEKYNNVVEILNIKDLQTNDLNSFQLALSEIVKDFNTRLNGYKKDYEIIFNLTGGFKSIQGFLQVLAMFYADKTIYIFESGNELLEIPKIPIKFDEIEVFEKNLNEFRKLSLGIDCDTSHIPDIYLLHIDNETSFSPWGEIAWQNAKQIIYKKRLYSPPITKIRYSEGFLKNIKNLQPNRIKELNEKIDDLAKYLETETNLKSLNFKSISEGAKKNSTHEFYANSDEAKRVYCHFEKDICVLDEYGNHL